ncbi:MAG: hypothetical protein UT17_C0001G0124 [Candidatus Woesebacteria bacterium GW2011_GWB1_39_10]|uniref:Uncharacterized protein n=2 Tax=Candidatus Woeseibacteriota TaxID=1752722 RepID=A0A0G0X6M0_9BACT|nr:MAG: hypothetical protein UT17_C0001G0124 [Candidatus Woesebacteria bacterium GW2011_GWB1_39_10]KKR92310.1 MAG: hypothetical protein UU42_C0002G0124 [Candidatus Woesebacteria bacterium GW2011_GWA1_41_13b]
MNVISTIVAEQDINAVMLLVELVLKPGDQLPHLLPVAVGVEVPDVS